MDLFNLQINKYWVGGAVAFVIIVISTFMVLANQGQNNNDSLSLQTNRTVAPLLINETTPINTITNEGAATNSAPITTQEKVSEESPAPEPEPTPVSAPTTEPTPTPETTPTPTPTPEPEPEPTPEPEPEPTPTPTPKLEPSVTLSISPENTTSSATLSWTSENTDSLTIDNGIGNVSIPSGSMVITPTEPTTYTITAIGSGGTVNSTAYIFTPTYHTNYPIALSFGDSLGNIQQLSQYNQYINSWPQPFPTLSVGDTITLTVNAVDPNDDPLEYYFVGPVIQGWSSDNKVTWTITDEDVGSQYFRVWVRDNDGYNRDGSIGDDLIQAHYEVLIPQ